MLDSARRTVIKLTTSSHRALLKKLPEMMFQMQYGHECYMSHDTWTLYCKGIVALAFRASNAVQKKKDDFWDDPRAADIEVDQPAVGEDADGEGGGKGRILTISDPKCPSRSRLWLSAIYPAGVFTLSKTRISSLVWPCSPGRPGSRSQFGWARVGELV